MQSCIAELCPFLSVVRKVLEDVGNWGRLLCGFSAVTFLKFDFTFKLALVDRNGHAMETAVATETALEMVMDHAVATKNIKESFV